MEMYSTLSKKAFQLIHCWTKLRNCPKFTATLAKKSKTSSLDSPTSSVSAQRPYIGTPGPESEERIERSMGKKAAKRLKRTKYDDKGDGFIKALTQVKDTVSRLSEARHETIHQLIELKKERFKVVEDRERTREERERMMYEMSILGIDTSTMKALLAKYYNSLKNDILKKRM